VQQVNRDLNGNNVPDDFDPPSPDHTNAVAPQVNHQRGNYYVYDPYVHNPLGLGTGLDIEDRKAHDLVEAPLPKGIIGSYGPIRGTNTSNRRELPRNDDYGTLNQIFAQSVQAVASLSTTRHMLDDAHADANDLKIARGDVQCRSHFVDILCY